MLLWLTNFFERLLTTPYKPVPDGIGFLERAETQTDKDVEVTVAIPDARESAALFGVPLANRGLQHIGSTRTRMNLGITFLTICSTPNVSKQPATSSQLLPRPMPLPGGI